MSDKPKDKDWGEERRDFRERARLMQAHGIPASRADVHWSKDGDWPKKRLGFDPEPNTLEQHVPPKEGDQWTLRLAGERLPPATRPIAAQPSVEPLLDVSEDGLNLRPPSGRVR